MGDVSWRSRLFGFTVFRKVDLPTLRMAQWALVVPPAMGAICIAIFVEPGENQRSAVRGLLFGLIVWYSAVFAAVFALILHRRLEARHLALSRFVSELRSYAVSNIETLRESDEALKGAETEDPPKDLEGSLDDEGNIEALKSKERDTFAAIIGILCKEAGVDCSRHAKAASQILQMAELQGVRISETTIETKIKLVPDAIAKRMR